MTGNPQLEDGYMRTAMELQRALCAFRIPGEARQVFDAIVYKTYGFRKTEDWITLTQFSDLTKLSTPDVCRGIRKLLDMKIIGKKASGVRSLWHINKHYGEWRVLAKKPVAKLPVAKKPIGTGEKANSLLAKKPDTSKDVTSDNITSDSGAILAPTPKQVSEDFFTNAEIREKTIEKLRMQGVSEVYARAEIKAFVAYWTERSQDGKKMRWQREKTFEVKRRLVTWLNNNFPKKSYGKPA